jgi:hypothetical protein
MALCRSLFFLIFGMSVVGCKDRPNPAAESKDDVSSSPRQVEKRIYLKAPMVRYLEDTAGFTRVQRGESSYRWNGVLFDGSVDDEHYHCTVDTRLVDLETDASPILQKRSYVIESTSGPAKQMENVQSILVTFTVDRFGVGLECSRADSSKEMTLSDVEYVLRSFVDVYTLPTDEAPYDAHQGEFPEALPNVDGAVVNQFLRAKDTCHFYSADSNSVIDGRVKVSERVRVVSDPSDLLAQCNVLSEAKTRCSTLEFAGHAYQLSVGLNHYERDNLVIIGANFDGTTLQLFPEDPELFAKIAACFDSVAEGTAPVIFSSCGGEWHAVGDGSGYTGYYRGKETAQNALAKSLRRTIYSAVGFSWGNKDGSETRCPSGWYVASPQK